MTGILSDLRLAPEAFLSLFFPPVCVVCGSLLVRQESIICLECLTELPRTKYHELEDNPVEKLFWGRVNVEHAAAFFRYVKGSAYHSILHQLKYQGKKEIGIWMGEAYGYELLDSPFQQADVIIPVPLHPSKQKRRGYNQSEMIALGISKILKIPMDTSLIIRKVDSDTQTKKNRLERWENVSEIFELTNPGLLKDKHIVLVDDVITTGATLEGIILSIEKQVSCRVSILCLAVAGT